jgi:carboxypeptidase family protein
VHARGLGRPAPRLLELRAGTVDRVEAALQEGGAVRLSVVAGGAPVPRALVEVLRGDQPVERLRSVFPEEEGAAWGRTDASGTLVLEDLEEGPYTLRVRAPGGATGSTGGDVRAGRTVDATAVLDGSDR